MADLIRISSDDLRSARRELSRLARQYPEVMDAAIDRIRQRFERISRRRYRTIYPPSTGGESAGTSDLGIRSQVSKGKAGGVFVALGGAKRRYLLGQEFGSDKYSQFPSRDRKGRFFWPVVGEQLEQAAEDAERGVDRVSRRVFPRP